MTVSKSYSTNDEYRRRLFNKEERTFLGRTLLSWGMWFVYSYVKKVMRVNEAHGLLERKSQFVLTFFLNKYLTATGGRDQHTLINIFA